MCRGIEIRKTSCIPLNIKNLLPLFKVLNRKTDFRVKIQQRLMSL